MPLLHGQAAGSRSGAAGSPSRVGRHDQRLPSSATATTVIPVATATATNLLRHFAALAPGLKIIGGASSPSCQLTSDPWSVSAATSPSHPTDNLINRRECTCQLCGTGTPGHTCCFGRHEPTQCTARRQGGRLCLPSAGPRLPPDGYLTSEAAKAPSDMPPPATNTHRRPVCVHNCYSSHQQRCNAAQDETDRSQPRGLAGRSSRIVPAARGPAAKYAKAYCGGSSTSKPDVSVKIPGAGQW
jgi:hypothetical protein